MYFSSYSGENAGINYRVFLSKLHDFCQPNSYLEIGTRNGNSIKSVNCDSILIDPDFIVNQDVFANGRKLSLFFQVTSDYFFKNYNPRFFVKYPIDMFFLDGMHRFENLLRDFINVEKHSHRNSLILIHDVLPINKRMTSRKLNSVGDKNKEPGTSRWWTGDVWKILLILKEYRADIHIFSIDCAPTGLLCCSCLNPLSSILENNYFDIINKYANMEFSLDKITSIYPVLDSNLLFENVHDLGIVFKAFE